jgi:hypothetical protein
MQKKTIQKLSLKKSTVSNMQQTAIKGGIATITGPCRTRQVSLCPCISANACSEYNCTIVA